MMGFWDDVVGDTQCGSLSDDGVSGMMLLGIHNVGAFQMMGFLG